MDELQVPRIMSYDFGKLILQLEVQILNTRATIEHSDIVGEDRKFKVSFVQYVRFWRWIWVVCRSRAVVSSTAAIPT
jgi:hypothetical protein